MADAAQQQQQQLEQPDAASEPERVGPPAPVPAPERADASPRGDLEARMFTARFNGPYAASVRDGVNEMLIKARLAARGVQLEGEGGPRPDALLSAIPSHLPAIGRVSSNFGARRSPFTGKIVRHNGIDITVATGDPVFATADGIVTYAGWRRAHGRIVVIDHGFGIVTKYAHNSRVLVAAGEPVRRGDVVAKAGSTGRSTGPHVHYEVWVNGRAIDPTTLMFDVPLRSADAKMLLAQHGGDGQPMGGEVELSDAPEMGVAHRLPRPDPQMQAAQSAAVLSVFFALALAVVAMIRPRSDYD